MSILITGGMGYIGSHTTVELLTEGYDVVIADNLSNSSTDALWRIEQITGEKPAFYKIDLLNKKALEELFKQHQFEAVIHFAGLKSVSESIAYPLKYYQDNLISVLNLCDVMEQFDVRHLIFSSSATVYGNPKQLPLTENCATQVLNPYGQTKLMTEEVLKDLARSDAEWHIAVLRYFNPVGAHPSGLIGENPSETPSNLMPYIARVASGKLESLNVFGADYPTEDGTGVRDYIHVVDLAKGHLKALHHIEACPGVEIFNLGTGRGYSVLEVVKTFEAVSGAVIPYRIVERRSGDIASCYADSTKARNVLGWNTEKGLDAMCQDAWRWETGELSVNKLDDDGLEVK